MLELFNHILNHAPEWSDSEYGIGMVGTPVNGILDYVMATPSGFAFFLDPEVNKMLKKVLNAWGESAYVLGNDSIGWFSDHGVHDLALTANIGQTSYKFHELFKCDPSKEHYGFKSWDDFFTRHLHEDKRPVASPEDDNVIANACESMPYNVARNVSARDKFWVKGQPYSLMDMVNMDPLYEHFVGGTVYQAFLSALSYHRWHSPVSGKIVKAYVKDGTYFSEPLFEGLGDPSAKGSIDEDGEKTDQGYLTATATRAIIFIEADNKHLGLVCFLGIGMTEVSTCDITVKEGQHVQKGDELGMFHYGGSTHCVIFRKGVELEEFPDIKNAEHNVPVRSKLAVVKKGCWLRPRMETPYAVSERPTRIHTYAAALLACKTATLQVPSRERSILEQAIDVHVIAIVCARILCCLLVMLLRPFRVQALWHLFVHLQHPNPRL
jgi:phosphatidylserine decarboxylase